MGRKGGSRHLKRLPAPHFWHIHPKQFKWAVKPSPGPHPSDMCIPLLVVLRDVLGYARTAREARRILSEGRVLVDGRVRRDQGFPVGLMDVIEMPDARSSYRVLPVEGKGLTLVKIRDEETRFKLCRVEDKITIDGGYIQLNLHDGRNILIPIKDPRNPVEDVFKTYDTLKIGIPEQKIIDHIEIKEGAYALVVKGRNLGRHGLITKIEPGTMGAPSMVTMQDATGETFQTIRDYVFLVGWEKPVITLGG